PTRTDVNQPRGEVEEPSRPVARGNVALHDQACPLEPEAAPFVAKVLDIRPAGAIVAGTARADSQVLAEGADLISHFGDKTRARCVEGYVVVEVDVAAVVDEAPARSAHQHAAPHRHGVCRVDGTDPVEVNAVTAARIGPGFGDEFAAAVQAW